MTILVFDTESDGFRDEATKLHCICLKDISTMALGAPESVCERFYTPHPDLPSSSIENGLQRLSEASLLIGQNIIGHDLPLLKRLYGWVPTTGTRVFDTQTVSRLLNPDRTKPSGYSGKGGPNSLECWGFRLGRWKVVHEEWSTFSRDMLFRCSEDVEINYLVYLELLKEIGNHDWQEAVEIEHEVQRIITQQEINGVQFDRDRAKLLVSQLTDRIESIDSRILPTLPKKLVIPYDKPIEDPFRKDGKLTKRAESWLEDQADLCSGPFSRVKWLEMNLGSQEQVKEYLLSIGWQPDEWNFKGGERSSPRITESSLETIEGGIGTAVKERTLIGHRKSQIEGWLGRLRSDGRITAGANTCGTNTGRFRHIDVVNVPKASKKVFLGYEMRSLFIVPENKVLVGHDAAGLELRMLAHYMDDKKFTEELIHGDIHSRNQEMAGLPTRDLAKSFIYAFLYGAGDEKIGKLIGGVAKDGRALKHAFLANLPSLKRLIDRSKHASRKGFLKGLDGRKVMMRSFEDQVMEHKALNTLLQSAGAIVMKKSMILLDQYVRENKLDVLKVIDMHDEAQAEVIPEHVELYKQLAVRSIVDSGLHFKLNCPLAGEAKTGKNWAETH
jgi:DNA polymerase I-like protein with 3'-5' exonuclease and polymerase domains